MSLFVRARLNVRWLLLVALLVPLSSAAYSPPHPPTPVVFWSDHGPAAVGRVVTTSISGDPNPRSLLAALLAGPTAEERSRGVWSAIPQGTALASLEVRADHTVFVRLDVPPEALATLDADAVETIIQQVALTLQPVGWRDLHVQARHPATGTFVPLTDFLPALPDPRKETSSLPQGGRTREGGEVALSGQPPGFGQGQPAGGLTGRTVYVSAGHGWEWTGTAWRTQRLPYPNPPYVGPIIEDFNNAEAVNQYLLIYLWNAGAMVWPARERDMNETAVIANNDGAGYAESGSWTTATPGYDLEQPGGQTYRTATTVTGPATAVATWTLSLPADGQYAVYVWYRPGSNRAADAHYTVHHAGGRTEVTVDQTEHGITWRYIGTYGFRAAEGARVTLDNRSATAGRLVVADAVRVGGGTFDSLYGIETTATQPPYEPWWETAAFYYVQRQGLDPDDWPYFNDVVARPMYARWEHAGTGDDAVYISWHTNGYSGYQYDYSGTVSYIHNGETYPATEGSAALRHAIHTEIVRDLRLGWNSAWPDLGERSLNLGELRMLWDSDPTVRMPGALIEVAYHDHPGDTDALKEPEFERLVARAVYQGILHYFEQRDGVDLVELPEPPTHLAVQNLGAGQVLVSWQASPYDSQGLAGDPATGYRVYISTDGVGWSNGMPVATTSAILSGLTPGQLLFIRVTATNAGGESFPTETLAVRVGATDSPPLLLVNGFDRLNRTMLVPDTYAPTGQTHMRMLLDRMNRYDYVIQHGATINYPFDSASNEAVQAGVPVLNSYGMVDWLLGEESVQDETLNSTEQGLLANFLSGGGALFISGAEIGWDLDYLGSAADRAFYNGWLRADYAGDDAGTYQVAPAAGSIFAGLPTFRFDAPGMYDPDYPDQLTPLGGAAAALTYQGGLGGTAAVQYANGCQRLVHFGFPFETIEPAQRQAVMGRILDFLDDCAVQEMRSAITTPQEGAAYIAVPPFSGTAWATAGVQRVEVSLRRHADNLYWNGSAWGTTEWQTAAGTALWSFPMPSALDVGMYTARARVWDLQGHVEDTPAQATFSFFVPSRFVHLPMVTNGFGTPAPTCSEAIVNGGFETNEAWWIVSTAYPAAYVTSPVYSGARSMRVGIPVNASFRGSLYSSVAQTVTLPAGSQATLRYWVYPVSENSDDGDLQYVWLVDGSGTTHFLSMARDNLAAWVSRQLDLSAFAGQTVRLHFSVRNDADDDVAVMYLDEVSLEVCLP